jgi:hypothetical protein
MALKQVGLKPGGLFVMKENIARSGNLLFVAFLSFQMIYSLYFIEVAFLKPICPT